MQILVSNSRTVGTPYNTVLYSTGSNIVWLGHGSQNSWCKLWIPVVKSAPVRVIFTWKVSPRREFKVAPTSQMWTQWKQRHDSPWSYHLDVIVTFLWYGTISIICCCDHQSAAKKVLLMQIAFVYFLLTREHIYLAPAPGGFLFAGKMDPVRVTKITQLVVETLNQF